MITQARCDLRLDESSISIIEENPPFCRFVNNGDLLRRQFLGCGWRGFRVTPELPYG